MRSPFTEVHKLPGRREKHATAGHLGRVAMLLMAKQGEMSGVSVHGITHL